MRIFEPAIRELKKTGSDLFGPTSFQAYLKENKITGAKTAPNISIDSHAKLAPELKENDLMVFRLGIQEGGRHTRFALMRTSGTYRDFFLFDSDLTDGVEAQVFIPRVSLRSLFAFQLLPSPTETSFVNLALASGLLPHSLGVIESDHQIVPATGQSAFDFVVRPRSGLDVTWQHRHGQVEFDAVFVAQREGKEIVFVVEAKRGKPASSIAKHKLVYPISAIRREVPHYMDIVPVFMRTWSGPDGQHFLITECEFDSRGGAAISSLTAKCSKERILIGFGAEK